VILEKLVGRDSHNDLAWLVFNKGGKREYRAVTNPDEQAEEDQKSK
jgi:hypothetical protein